MILFSFSSNLLAYIIHFSQQLILALLLVILSFINIYTDYSQEKLDSLFLQLKNADSFEKAEQIENKIWKIWFNLGDPKLQKIMDTANALVEQRSYEQAIALYDDLLVKTPNWPEVWNRRATLHYIMGNYRLSINDIARTVELEPRHFGAWSGLGLIMLVLDKPEEAVKAYQKVIEIHPNSISAKQELNRLNEKLQIQNI